MAKGLITFMKMGVLTVDLPENYKEMRKDDFEAWVQDKLDNMSDSQVIELLSDYSGEEAETLGYRFEENAFEPVAVERIDPQMEMKSEVLAYTKVWAEYTHETSSIKLRWDWEKDNG